MADKNNKSLFVLSLILGSMIAIGPLSVDMYLPAFGAIENDLNTTPQLVGYTLTSYLFGIGIGQLIMGPLTDRYGRKLPTQIGLLVFSISTLLISLSTNIYEIIGLRVIMAFGACVGMITSKAIVRDLFEPQDMARVFSMLMLVMGIAPIIGPTFGGFMAAEFGWRSLFYFLAAYSFLMILSISFFLKETKEPDKTISLKPLAIIKDYIVVFKRRKFLYYALAGSLLFSGLFAYISGASFIYEDYFHFDKKTFGMAFGANAAGYIIGAQLNNLLLRRYSPARICRVVTVVQAIIAIGLVISLFFPGITQYTILIGIWTFLFSLGFITPNTTTESLASFTKLTGSASALIGSMQMGFGAVISAVVSYFISDSLLPIILTMAVCSVGGAIILQLEKRTE